MADGEMVVDLLSLQGVDFDQPDAVYAALFWDVVLTPPQKGSLWKRYLAEMGLPQTPAEDRAISAFG